MDRSKPPGQWSDGVREPRVVLSAEPNRALLGPSKRRAVDLATLDHRAPHPVVDAADDEAERRAPAESSGEAVSERSPP